MIAHVAGMEGAACGGGDERAERRRAQWRMQSREQSRNTALYAATRAGPPPCTPRLRLTTRDRRDARGSGENVNVTTYCTISYRYIVMIIIPTIAILVRPPQSL